MKESCVKEDLGLIEAAVQYKRACTDVDAALEVQAAANKVVEDVVAAMQGASAVLQQAALKTSYVFSKDSMTARISED